MEVVNLSKGTVVNLSKGSVVNLSKGEAGLHNMIVGLGWDPVYKSKFGDKPKKKGFLSRLFGSDNSGSMLPSNHNIDCDAFAVAMCNDQYVNDGDHLLYYGCLTILNKALVHTGDNLTGDGDGDDEQIIINLDKIPTDVNKVIIAVNIYQGRQRNQSFGQLQNAFIRIVNQDTNVEACRYDLSGTDEFSKFVTVKFGELSREPGSGWTFKAIGEPHNANSIPEFCKVSCK